MQTYMVLSTCPADQSQKIAHHLINKHVAACVNIIPTVQSVYLWENKICTDQESLLLIKTNDVMISECLNQLKQLHPYEVPEMISMKIDAAHSLTDYLQWINSVCHP